MHTVEGTVIDHITGLPIEDARVMLQKEGGSMSDIAQLTGEDGSFKWPSLASGEYDLHVHYNGYESQVIQLSCQNEGNYSISVALLKN